MEGVLFPTADLLVRPGANAAPTFGYSPFSDRAPEKEQLLALCRGVVCAYPSRGGDDGMARQIALLPSV